MFREVLIVYGIQEFMPVQIKLVMGSEISRRIHWEFSQSVDHYNANQNGSSKYTENRCLTQHSGFHFIYIRDNIALALALDMFHVLMLVDHAVWV